jgi:23S rRNA pseudouridine2605 synthase
MRLNKFLARSGVDSRRKCDELIKNKKISINSNIVTDFSYQVKDDDVVLLNGKYLDIQDESIIYILNKPKGYVCTSKDTHSKLKVVDLIDTNLRLFTIGRLDRDTTGIILLTNDGDISNYLTHPKYKKEKKYYVKSKGKIGTVFLKQIKNGYILKDGTKVKAKIKLLSQLGNNFEWDIILEEGKNREIKRIFSNFNAKVTLLHRYYFSGFQLNNLNPGKYKKLSKEQINKIIK